MRTLEELKKGLEYCIQGPCPGDECPYYSEVAACSYHKTKDSLAYIRRLKAELEAVKRERDALMVELKTYGCNTCKYYDTPQNEPPCENCDGESCWERVGVCPENTNDDRSCLNCKHQGPEGRGICMDCNFRYSKYEPLENTEVQEDGYDY